ncbi:hypothetical protein AX15_007128 [Amanita polypyramis BW_CC]|nr:hypothetical protein AX15_007128 [Amanita polypyramis BW_CC]
MFPQLSSLFSSSCQRCHFNYYITCISSTMSDSDSSRANGSGRAATGVAKPPGAQIRRRAGAQASRPNSTRAAGAGGSSNTMLKLYTDDSPGLRVDPFIVLVLSLSFIGSIFFLHISAKIIRAFSK